MLARGEARLRRLPFRGTLLNAALVAVGSTLGLALGSALPQDLKAIALTGLGLVTIGMGLKLFLETANVLALAAAIALGGIVGQAIGIDRELLGLAEWTRRTLGGEGRFNEGLVTASVLFCVGPLTLLGCLQDGLERRIELLAFKSVMDGIASVFLAAALGPGVLVSAVVVLVAQGLLTAFASPLGRLARDKALMAETTAVGGPILMAIGLGLADVKRIPSENYLPALFFAPLISLAFRRARPHSKVAQFVPEHKESTEIS